MLCGNQEKENLITLGWLHFGSIWNYPSLTIYVRSSRYSYPFLLENPDFTINVLSKQYQKEIQFCGSHSGRYCDKFKETGLVKAPSKKITVSSLKAAEIVVECSIIGNVPFLQEQISDQIQAQFYPQGDYHQQFIAKILNIKEK
ncbi:MAG: flavin reductase [Spirochaetes bacterium]|nr:flavin reductase [Spirochaetota bacterium]